MSLKFVAKRATDQPVYLASKKPKNKENEMKDEEKVNQTKKKSEQRKKIEETERYKIYA